MPINTHRYGDPCPNDDIESLVYSLLYITKGRLPWDAIKISPSNYDKNLLKVKRDFKYYDWCGDNFAFLADILEYKWLQKNRQEVIFAVIKKLMGVRDFEENKNKSGKNKFEFIVEVKQALNNYIKCKEKTNPFEKILKILFESYPIDFHEFHKNLNRKKNLIIN